MSVCIGGFQARHHAKDLHLQRHSNKLNPFLLLSPGHVSPITQIRCQCCHKGQHRDGKWILGNREIKTKLGFGEPNMDKACDWSFQTVLIGSEIIDT